MSGRTKPGGGSANMFLSSYILPAVLTAHTALLKLFDGATSSSSGECSESKEIMVTVGIVFFTLLTFFYTLFFFEDPRGPPREETESEPEDDGRSTFERIVRQSCSALGKSFINFLKLAVYSLVIFIFLAARKNAGRAFFYTCSYLAYALLAHSEPIVCWFDDPGELGVIQGAVLIMIGTVFALFENYMTKCPPFSSMEPLVDEDEEPPSAAPTSSARGATSSAPRQGSVELDDLEPASV